MQSFWILKPFNPLFFVLVALFAALLVGAALLLKNRSETAKKIVLIAACAITFVGYFVY